MPSRTKRPAFNTKTFVAKLGAKAIVSYRPNHTVFAQGDPAEATPDRPDALGLLHLGRTGRVVRGDPVDGAIENGLPELVDLVSAA